MANIQLERLNLALLKQLNSSQCVITTEPLSLSAKMAKTIEVGDWIDLGKELPTLFIKRGGELLYNAIFIEDGGVEAIKVIDLIEFKLPEQAGKKRIVLEGRLAIVDCSSLKDGKVLKFPWRVSNHIHLFHKNRLFASAKLISYKGGYAFEITELVNEA